MNKIVFIALTPYHIKVSNYLAKTKYSNNNKRIIITPFRYANKEMLENTLQKDLYDDIIYYDFNYSTKNVMKNFYKNRKNALRELKEFEKSIINYKPELLVYYNDQPIPYQSVFMKVKKYLNCKLMLVEEGLGMYLKSEKFNLKNYILYIVRKYLFGVYKAKFFVHGKGGYEDIVYLREPNLINAKSNKIKMTNDEFKGIVKQSYQEVDFDILPNSILLSPAGTIYNKEIMLSIFEIIFKYSKSKNKTLYLKLHPAERYIDEIKALVMRYEESVVYIDDNRYTSEDFILNKNINTIISDYSSTLINAYYLRDDIELYSYMNILENEYNINLGLDITILEKLFNENIIKKIEI
nr:polysialyltransferase family glycosyltransferase [uncultured Romboutsia sp.]